MLTSSSSSSLTMPLLRSATPVNIAPMPFQQFFGELNQYAFDQSRVFSELYLSMKPAIEDLEFQLLRYREQKKLTDTDLAEIVHHLKAFFENMELYDIEQATKHYARIASLIGKRDIPEQHFYTLSSLLATNLTFMLGIYILTAVRAYTNSDIGPESISNSNASIFFILSAAFLANLPIYYLGSRKDKELSSKIKNPVDICFIGSSTNTFFKSARALIYEAYNRLLPCIDQNPLPTTMAEVVAKFKIMCEKAGTDLQVQMSEEIYRGCLLKCLNDYKKHRVEKGLAPIFIEAHKVNLLVGLLAIDSPPKNEQERISQRAQFKNIIDHAFKEVLKPAQGSAVVGTEREERKFSASSS